MCVYISEHDNIFQMNLMFYKICYYTDPLIVEYDGCSLSIVLVLLITCSFERSSYCMADCDDNGHQPSLYLQICCHLSKRGKLFIIHKIKVIKATSFVHQYSQLHVQHSIIRVFNYMRYTLLVPQVIIIYYYLIVVRLKCTVIWGIVTVMESEVGQEWAFVNMSEPGSS